MITVNTPPNSVQALRILMVGKPDRVSGDMLLTLSNRSTTILSGAQAKTYKPDVGDYYVTPSEGVSWCAPVSLFQKSYTVVS